MSSFYLVLGETAKFVTIVAIEKEESVTLQEEHSSRGLVWPTSPPKPFDQQSPRRVAKKLDERGNLRLWLGFESARLWDGEKCKWFSSAGG